MAESGDEIVIVLSSTGRAIVHAIHKRRQGECPLNWNATAKNLKAFEAYLREICRIPIPRSYEIPWSEYERAKLIVSLDEEVLRKDRICQRKAAQLEREMKLPSN
jgi:hypothetical protein